ncbi:MAG: FkbM family methyltransferase [Ignavibacteriales bacterium]|nr:FkbM family methyltransferase [Ignavibacteriales bacterium]
MMALKRWLDRLIGITGYQIRRQPSLTRQIARGNYRWLQERGIATVLDVGANTGQFAAKIRQILPQAMIYSFEPLESCFKELVAVSTRLQPMRCFNCALGSESSLLTMQRNEYTPSSSILPITPRTVDAFPSTAKSVEEQVTVRALDELIGELSLKKEILMKVDVQGYELNVLRGAERSLPQIAMIIVETSFVELYKNQPLFHDVYKFLTGREFSYAGNFDQLLSPVNGAVLQSDAIFVNTRR